MTASNPTQIYRGTVLVLECTIIAEKASKGIVFNKACAEKPTV
jgi:hypothetical protein